MDHMHPELAVQIEHLQTAVVMLIAGILVAIGYILTVPVQGVPKPPPVEFCKLHARPISDCRGQHKLDG